MDFPDVIEITPVAIDAQNGAETKGVPVRVRCYYEDATRVLTNDNGTPVQCVTFAMIPARTQVKRGDLARRISKSGVLVSDEPLERIVRLSPVGGYAPSHIELFTGNAGGFA
jgi:hypothetical protein